MRILLACECSNVTSKALRKKGHYVLSADIQSNDECQKHHYMGDVMDLMDEDFDMLIGHPPCPKLSKAGARWLYQGGVINNKRFQDGLEAKSFFLKLWNSKFHKTCLENPTPLKIFDLPKHSQAIQPYEFGHPFSKRTLLWLKNLPPLKPTLFVNNYTPYLPSNTGGAKRGQKATFVNISLKEKSKTFQGIADAMADQWG